VKVKIFQMSESPPKWFSNLMKNLGVANEKELQRQAKKKSSREERQSQEGTVAYNPYSCPALSDSISAHLADSQKTNFVQFHAQDQPVPLLTEVGDFNWTQPL
jgi:hypothetical protein